ncbi:GNAT family N-acetyltransferase [Brevibacillus sp. SYSU BS000544]|uniref:GNAT family N-acetyltransferase n=1 Tax=Brevibacillus sp. SYSU BS000544 TaxID=3416443 RepID=UPI003CE46F21
MIRKVTQKDHKQIIAFLQEDKSFNLFIIGDIENFGYEQDFQELWGEYDEDGELRAVLLRYYHSYLPYAKGEFDVEGFVSIIQKDENAEILSGKKEVVERFGPYLPFKKQKQQFFAEITEMAVFDKNKITLPIEKATIGDCDSIFALKEQIKEFEIGTTARESFRKTISSGTGRTYFYKEDNNIIACASTTAENSFSGMVVGVCTHPDARRRGMATACVQKLCEDLLQQGKTLCLFYDNPAAGSIYRRIGFKEIGQWCMNYL